MFGVNQPLLSHRLIQCAVYSYLYVTVGNLIRNLFYKSLLNTTNVCNIICKIVRPHYLSFYVLTYASCLCNYTVSSSDLIGLNV
jgi:hypothetical protein